MGCGISIIKLGFRDYTVSELRLGLLEPKFGSFELRVSKLELGDLGPLRLFKRIYIVVLAASPIWVVLKIRVLF